MLIILLRGIFSDNPRMYKDKDYIISRVDIPAIATQPILPPPMTTPRGVGLAGEYHSDTADSLLEVPTDKSLTISTLGTSSGTEKKRIKKRVKKPRNIVVTDSDDELNSTTLFTVNSSAKLRADGSVEYKDFKSLPLTPTNMRKKYKRDEEAAVKSDVPPLDFSGLRGSHESISFQPYTATFRSTDTVITDRMLPTLREERQKSKLNPVTDTEV